MNNKETINQLSESYFEGRASNEQKALLAREMATAEGKETFREAESMWQAESSLSEDERKSLLEIAGRIEQKREHNARSRGFIRGTALASAFAAVLVCISLSISFNREEAAQPFILSTKSGGSMSVNLPDGSKVFLGANSRMAYTSAFSPERRNVSLSGDAYFNVTKDPEHPFLINLGECSITVKGTVFRVSAPEGANEIETVLVSGAIDMSTPSGEYEVRPGTRVTYNSASGQIKTKAVDTSSYLALIEGRLEFKSMTISELCASLEKLYGKEIILDEQLKANPSRYTLKLSNRESFEDVMSVLSVMMPMDISGDGDTTRINSK